MNESRHLRVEENGRRAGPAKEIVVNQRCIARRGYKFFTFLSFVFLFVFVHTLWAQDTKNDDLNVALMQSTFQISGPLDNDHTTVGTMFLLGNLIPDTTDKWQIVMVTAAHVLNEIRGQYAVVVFRKRDASGTWIRVPMRITIRKGDTALWTKASDADVAVAYVRLPFNPFDQIIPVTALATDKTLIDYKMTPGTELNCLGYPYSAAANEIGFPILRGGTIASYPLTPSADYPTFMFDFRVFGGNSGGPVYFSQPPFRGSVGFGGRAQFVVGLVTDEALAARHNNDPLSLAVVIQATVIQKAIETLPRPGTPEAASQSLQLTPIPANAQSLEF